MATLCTNDLHMGDFPGGIPMWDFLWLSDHGNEQVMCEACE